MSTVLPTAWPEPGAAVQLVHRHVRDHHVLALGHEPELAARARRVDVHAGVERDRDVEVLARGPERVVHGVVERQLVDVGRRADRTHLAARGSFTARLGLGDRELGRPGAAPPAIANSRRGCAAQYSATQSLYARWQSSDELDVVERVDRIVRAEEQRRRRVEHGDVDAVAVHVGDAGVGVVTAGDAQALEQVVELLRGHAHRRGHRVLQLPTAARTTPPA